MASSPPVPAQCSHLLTTPYWGVSFKQQDLGTRSVHDNYIQNGLGRCQGLKEGSQVSVRWVVLSFLLSALPWPWEFRVTSGQDRKSTGVPCSWVCSVCQPRKSMGRTAAQQSFGWYISYGESAGPNAICTRRVPSWSVTCRDWHQGRDLNRLLPSQDVHALVGRIWWTGQPVCGRHSAFASMCLLSELAGRRLPSPGLLPPLRACVADSRGAKTL